MNCPIFLAVFITCCSSLKADLVLARKGEARAAIFVPAEIMESEAKENWRKLQPELLQARLRESVKDLAHYLGKISGAKFEIVTGAPQKGDRRVPILVGELAAKKFGHPTVKTEYQQGLRLVATSKEIGLLGESDLGSSYAIYELLHRLGCRWFMPSEMGEVVPKRETLSLMKMDVSLAPTTKFRGIWYAPPDFMRRNRLGGIYLSAGHALESYITKEQREEHPEWKAIVKGKPHGHMIKWTHPGVADAITNQILERLKKNPETTSVSLSPSDGAWWDESYDTKYDAGDWDEAAQAVSKTDRLLVLMNRIVPRISKDYPKVLFGMLAYVDYTRPPVREKVPKNLVPQIAPITYNRAHPMTTENHPNGFIIKDLVEGWGKIVPNGVSAYWYTYNLAEVSAPNPFITKYSTDLPILFANNVQFWQPETLSNFESCMPALYLGMRLSWDRTLKPGEVISDLMTKFYGEAAEPMSRYWHYIDDAWIEAREFTGCGFGYLRIFTPEILKNARALMNEALAGCESAIEFRRVQLANESLTLFELFMKLRRDLAEGRLKNLKYDADIWRGYAEQLARNYKSQYCFASRWSSTWPVAYFNIFFGKPYDDGARIARSFVVLTKNPLRNWKVITDKEIKGESLGYTKPEFGDGAWKATDVGIETWSTIGHHNYFGHMWYRKTVKGPAAAKGKKVYLWIPSTDGSVKVFINGKHVPWLNKKGEEVGIFNGYCTPASFDVTDLLKTGKDNLISLLCHRNFFNEIGTGGLLAPPMIYREK